MKIKLIICSVFAVLLLTAAASQTKVVAQKPSDIVGGYADLSVNSKEAKKFTRWAVAARSKSTHKRIKLVKIVKAEHQLVAGENYRLCMDVREGRRRAHRVTVVVYENLKGKLKLSHWKTGEC